MRFIIIFLKHKIQSELITYLTTQTKSKIIKKIKEAKYFYMIRDCTPNVSREEQKYLILKCIDISNNLIKIEGYFIKFLKVDDIVEQRHFDKKIFLYFLILTLIM